MYYSAWHGIFAGTHFFSRVYKRACTIHSETKLTQLLNDLVAMQVILRYGILSLIRQLFIINISAFRYYCQVNSNNCHAHLETRFFYALTFRGTEHVYRVQMISVIRMYLCSRVSYIVYRVYEYSIVFVQGRARLVCCIAYSHRVYRSW